MSYVIPTVRLGDEAEQESQSCVRTASLGLSPLSLHRRFRRAPDGRTRCLLSPGTRSCRRRRDPCSAWRPSVCRPTTEYASGLRDRRGNLCADSRRRFLPADRRSSRQTIPCVLAVRRPCSSPPLSFHRSVVATENCAMAVPCWLCFTSGSRPRFPINITFCMGLLLLPPSFLLLPSFLLTLLCGSTHSVRMTGL